MCAMASPIAIIDDLYGRSGQGVRAATPRQGARLVDPGFPCEPGVIDVADRATGAPEKHRAAPKAVVIGPDAGGNRASGLGAFDHDHAHVSLSPGFGWLLFEANTGRLDCACRWCAYMGASRTCFDRAWGYMLVPAPVLTGRIAT